MASEMSIVRSIMDSGIYHVPSSFFLRFAQKTRIGARRTWFSPARELWCVAYRNASHNRSGTGNFSWTDRNQFKPDRYFIASDAIGFGTDPIHFGAPACRFVSIPHRFGLDRIGVQPATRGFGSFRYHFKSKRYRFNPNRYRNDHKQLPLKSINGRDTRFFDITLSASDITLTQSDIVSSHPEISWSRQRFTPGLRQFIPFCRRLSSGRSDIAPRPTAVSRSRTRLSLRRSDGGPAPRSREQDSRGPGHRIRP